LTFRERLPFVGGFTRTVVVVDVPLARPERLLELTGDVATIVANGWMERFSQGRIPDEGLLVKALAVVGLIIATLFATFSGVSIEANRLNWACVIFRARQVQPEAQLAVHAATLVGDGIEVFAAIYDEQAEALLLPSPRSRLWRAGRRLRRSFKDIVEQLAPQVTVRHAERESEADTAA